MTLTLAGGLPDKLSSIRQELNYVFVIEADGSGDEDYEMTVQNREDGHWSPGLTDYAIGQSYFADEYPGTFKVADNTIAMVVPLFALGSPSSIRVQAITQRADHEPGDVVAEDQAPEGDQFRPTDGWLTVRRPP